MSPGRHLTLEGAQRGRICQVQKLLAYATQRAGGGLQGEARLVVGERAYALGVIRLCVAEEVLVVERWFRGGKGAGGGLNCGRFVWGTGAGGAGSLGGAGRHGGGVGLCGGNTNLGTGVPGDGRFVCVFPAPGGWRCRRGGRGTARNGAARARPGVAAAGPGEAAAVCDAPALAAGLLRRAFCGAAPLGVKAACRHRARRICMCVSSSVLVELEEEMSAKMAASSESS
eukprot:6213441-Pleurochrysis_carterae.AAC.2